MTVKDLKDLEKVIKLCRRMGIEAIEVDNVKLNLGPAPKPVTQHSVASDFPEASMKIPQYTATSGDPDAITSDELTPEQLLMWSSAEAPTDTVEG